MNGKWLIRRWVEDDGSDYGWGWVVTSPDGHIQDVAGDWSTAMRWTCEYIAELSA